MSKENKTFTDEEAEREFKESVIRFADAFCALTDEEKKELQAYVEGRCKEAEEEYEIRTGKKRKK